MLIYGLIMSLNNVCLVKMSDKLSANLLLKGVDINKNRRKELRQNYFHFLWFVKLWFNLTHFVVLFQKWVPLALLALSGTVKKLSSNCLEVYTGLFIFTKITKLIFNIYFWNFQLFSSIQIYTYIYSLSKNFWKCYKNLAGNGLNE